MFLNCFNTQKLKIFKKTLKKIILIYIKNIFKKYEAAFPNRIAC